MSKNVTRHRRPYVVILLIVLTLVAGGFAIRRYQTRLNDTERFLTGIWRDDYEGNDSLNLGANRIVWQTSTEYRQWRATEEELVYEYRREYSMRTVTGLRGWLRQILRGSERNLKMSLRRINENKIEVDGQRYDRLSPPLGGH